MKVLFTLLFITQMFTSCLPGGPSELVWEDNSIKRRSKDFKIVSFDQVSSIFAKYRCTKCHKWARSETALFAKNNLDNLWDLNNPVYSKLYQEVKNRTMPKKAPFLNADEAKLVLNYIISLEKQNDTPLPGPVIRRVEYKEVYSIFEKYWCHRCHIKVETEIGLKNYDWYNKEDPELSPLYLQVRSGEMPMGSKSLTSEEVQIVLDYIKGFN